MQFQDLFLIRSLNPLPKKINRFALLSATAMTVGILIYGCGENKISQCNKLVAVANKAKSLVAPKDVVGTNQLASNIEQIRSELQAIAIQDPKLKDLQTQLVVMYGDVSQVLKAQAQATESKDKVAMDKAKQELLTVAGKENDIVDRLNDFCVK